MKKWMLLCSISGLLTGAAMGIDRDASMIDSAGASVADYRHVDFTMFTLTSEKALKTDQEEWAIVVGVSFGEADPDVASSGNAWAASLGLKYYVTELASFTLAGMYASQDVGTDVTLTGGDLFFKLRFLSAEETISPFVMAGGLLENVEFDVGPRESDSFTELVLRAGLGCDFMMTEDMALSVSGAFVQSEKVSGDGEDTSDGWTASVSMVYYWE